MVRGEAPVSILIYDDDTLCAGVLAAILRDCGYTVQIASHFGPALEALDATRVDVLVADIVIPGGVNGMAMARMARVRRPSIKTVYLTGYDLGDVDAEVDGPILRKPVSDERLLDAVRGVLAQ
jgi:CheY-like chemotaxis protein